MEIQVSINDAQTAITITAITDPVDIVTLVVYQNSVTSLIANNLLVSPGFVNEQLEINATNLPAVFDSEGILKTGYLIVQVAAAGGDTNDYGIVIGSKEIDCCIANLIDTEYNELDSDIELKKQHKAQRMFLLLNGAKISAANKDLDGAVRKYSIAYDICANCGCASSSTFSTTSVFSSTSTTIVNSNVTTATFVVEGGIITRQEWIGKTIEYIRQYFKVYVDGVELLTKDATTLQNSSTGTVALNTSAYNGLTAYLTNTTNE